MSELTARQIADHLHGEIIGNPDQKVTGISGIKEAREGDLTFIHNPKYVCEARETKASVIIVGHDWTTELPQTLIRCKSPSLAFAQACELIAAPTRIKWTPGISPCAHVSPTAKLGNDVSIQPFAVIEDEAVIGDRTVIGSGVYVGHQSRIGTDCLLYANVNIRERCILGNRVIIHHGACIGSDGFGFATVDGVHHKIPQIGIVEIGDNVEIGAGTTIDRGRFGKTVIGDGTKIDNLVQIGHNVVIGKHCLIVALVGIAGSTEIGNHVIIAGQAGIVGHIKIGDGAVIMAQAGVVSDVPAGSRVLGAPAIEERDAKRIVLSTMRLPDLMERVRRLEQQLKQKTDS